MEKKSNLNVIVAIIVVLAFLGAVVAIKFSQGSSEVTNTKGGTKTEETNPAAKVEPPEIAITDENFSAEIEDYKGVAMVDMYSPTCPHCQNIGPVITEIAKEVVGKYKIGKLNVMDESKTTEEFKIESVPALIFFKDGKEVKRLIGEQTKEKILQALEESAK